MFLILLFKLLSQFPFVSFLSILSSLCSLSQSSLFHPFFLFWSIHRPPQFFRLGGHRGAQSILITSSESVSSYSIVTWCWLTSWILNTNNKTCSPELQNLAGFTAVIMAKQLSLASWVSKRKKRVGDPEERCHVITYTQEQSGQNWIDWHCEAVYSNKWKKKEIFWNSTNERITSKIYYHIFWFFFTLS